MAKDDAVRIADTIAFIRNATVPGPHMGQRNTIADLLRDRDLAGTIPTTVSPAMSQGHNFAVLNRDEVKESRYYRRAIILIRMVLQNADRTIAPPDTAQIADAHLPATLGNYLGQVDTTLQDVTTKLALLKANPVSFLSNNNFNMVGDATGGVVSYMFVHDSLSNQYNLEPKVPGSNYVGVPVNVFHLPVDGYGSLIKINRPHGGGQAIQVFGHAVAGADLMATTQLTGCSIVYYHGAAGLVGGHIQPIGIGAEAMCTNLRADAVLNGAPQRVVTGVFGAQAARGGNVNNYVRAGCWNYCVGVRHAGVWDLYAQQRPKTGLAGAIAAWKIT